MKLLSFVAGKNLLIIVRKDHLGNRLYNSTTQFRYIILSIWSARENL